MHINFNFNIYVVIYSYYINNYIIYLHYILYNRGHIYGRIKVLQPHPQNLKKNYVFMRVQM